MAGCCRKIGRGLEIVFEPPEEFFLVKQEATTKGPVGVVRWCAYVMYAACFGVFLGQLVYMAGRTRPDKTVAATPLPGYECDMLSKYTATSVFGTYPNCDQQAKRGILVTVSELQVSYSNVVGSFDQCVSVVTAKNLWHTRNLTCSGQYKLNRTSALTTYTDCSTLASLLPTASFNESVYPYFKYLRIWLPVLQNTLDMSRGGGDARGTITFDTRFQLKSNNALTKRCSLATDQAFKADFLAWINHHLLDTETICAPFRAVPPYLCHREVPSMQTLDLLSHAYASSELAFSIALVVVTAILACLYRRTGDTKAAAMSFEKMVRYYMDEALPDRLYTITEQVTPKAPLHVVTRFGYLIYAACLLAFLIFLGVQSGKSVTETQIATAPLVGHTCHTLAKYDSNQLALQRWDKCMTDGFTYISGITSATYRGVIATYEQCAAAVTAANLTSNLHYTCWNQPSTITGSPQDCAVMARSLANHTGSTYPLLIELKYADNEINLVGSGEGARGTIQLFANFWTGGLPCKLNRDAEFKADFRRWLVQRFTVEKVCKPFISVPPYQCTREVRMAPAQVVSSAYACTELVFALLGVVIATMVLKAFHDPSSSAAAAATGWLHTLKGYLTESMAPPVALYNVKRQVAPRGPLVAVRQLGYSIIAASSLAFIVLLSLGSQTTDTDNRISSSMLPGYQCKMLGKYTGDVALASFPNCDFDAGYTNALQPTQFLVKFRDVMATYDQCVSVITSRDLVHTANYTYTNPSMVAMRAFWNEIDLDVPAGKGATGVVMLSISILAQPGSNCALLSNANYTGDPVSWIKRNFFAKTEEICAPFKDMPPYTCTRQVGKPPIELLSSAWANTMLIFTLLVVAAAAGLETWFEGKTGGVRRKARVYIGQATVPTPPPTADIAGPTTEDGPSEAPPQMA